MPYRFEDDGFEVFVKQLDPGHLINLKDVVDRVCDRFRAENPDCLANCVALADYTRQHPERNPGVDPDVLKSEPYILGNLIGLDPAFCDFLSDDALWHLAARLLQVDTAEVVYHYAQVIRKPALVGPALSWHRDYANSYVSTDGPHFIRLLIPLQESAEENGGTCVVPKSHAISDEEALRREGMEENGDGSVCPHLSSGDVLAIHSKLVHGGNPNRSKRDRDVLAVQFAVQSARILHSAKDFEALTLCSRNEMLRFASRERQTVNERGRLS
jgi:hypothetical protein